MTLPRNVGGFDRVLRVVAGSILLSVGPLLLADGCPCGWVDFALGIVGLATGISGFCVMYVPFGISTAGQHQPKPSDPMPQR